MLTAFARFGERTATIAPMPGTKGDGRLGEQCARAGEDLALGRKPSDNMYAPRAAGA
jgi:hypothetical protein